MTGPYRTGYVCVNSAGGVWQTDRGPMRPTADLEKAKRYLRWARGSAWRVVMVEVRELPGLDAQSIHEAAVQRCAAEGHDTPIRGPRGEAACSRCTADLEVPR